MYQYWSWLLTAVGVTGLYLAGRKNVYGWAVGIGAQVLWLAYALSTHQYGFLVSCLAYGWVYTKNFLSWRREHPSRQENLPSAETGNLPVWGRTPPPGAEWEECPLFIRCRLPLDDHWHDTSSDQTYHLT